jgi:hypothetical protein
MKKLILVCVGLAATLGVAFAAQQRSAAARPLAGKRVLVHLKTGFAHDDNQPCVAFNVAHAALMQGARVEMLFDAGAVVDLKIYQGKPTSLAYELPEKLKTILQAQFPEPKQENFPRTYQELLHWLHGQGVEVTFNGSLAQLTSLSNGVHDVGQLEPIAKPLSLVELLRHRQRADIYLVY